MKVRQGFVSNSSSSSFIILHHNDLKSVKDVESILPDCINTFRCSLGYGDDQHFEVLDREKVAEMVFGRIRKLSIPELKKIHFEYSDHIPALSEFSWIEFYSDTYLNREKDTSLDGEDEIKDEEKHLEESAKNNFSYYLCNCSDSNQIGSFLEHEILPMLCLKRYSHH